MTKVAMIGCGLIAAKRAAVLPAPLKVTTAYDIDPARATKLANSISNDVKIANSAEEALNGAEWAFIATRHSDLAQLGTLAVEVGCHVFLEKPGGVAPQELTNLRASASAKQRCVRVGYNHRFHPSMLRAHELVTSGKYGKLMNIRARYGHGGRIGYETEWRCDRKLSGGGELMDQGVHLIDLVRYFGGDVTLAFAQLSTDFWKVDVEDNAFLALDIEHGGTAWLHASWTEWKNLFSFEIALERAKLEITGLGGSYGTEKLTLYEMLPEMGLPLTSSWEWPFADKSWALEVEDAVSVAGGGEATGAGLDDAIAVLEIVEKAYATASAKQVPQLALSGSKS